MVRLSVLGAVYTSARAREALDSGGMVVEQSVELPVALPGLRVVRATTTRLHEGIKEHHGVGRIERGTLEWWGGGATWRSAPGSVLVKHAGDVHRDLARSGPTTFVSIVLPSEDIERVRGEGRPVTLAHLEARDERAAPFHRLLDAACGGADRLSLEVALAESIAALAAISSAQPDLALPIRRSVDYIRARLCESFTLDELSAHARTDKFHLCRAFRARIGMPPHAYLTHLRVARARQLLEGGVRASDVAPLVGFYDQAQLTRHFRRLVGTTPARYARAAVAP